MIKTYRYNHTEEFNKILFNFSKLHKYDDKKTFKESFNIFIEDNKDIIDIEKNRLLNMGYNGDINKKIYVSSRYYFRKKNENKNKEEKINRKKNSYLTCDKDIIKIIDEYILKDINKYDFKPHNSYIKFKEENIEIIDKLIVKYKKDIDIDMDKINKKIIKVYKNRCYIIKKNILESITNDLTL